MIPLVKHPIPSVYHLIPLVLHSVPPVASNLFSLTSYSFTLGLKTSIKTFHFISFSVSMIFLLMPGQSSIDDKV